MIDKLINDIEDVLSRSLDGSVNVTEIEEAIDKYKPLVPGDAVKITDVDGDVVYAEVISFSGRLYFMDISESKVIPRKCYTPTSIAELNQRHSATFERKVVLIHYNE